MSNPDPGYGYEMVNRHGPDTEHQFRDGWHKCCLATDHRFYGTLHRRRVEPGEGYRLLAMGDTISLGDEYYSSGEWSPLAGTALGIGRTVRDVWTASTNVAEMHGSMCDIRAFRRPVRKKTGEQTQESTSVCEKPDCTLANEHIAALSDDILEKGLASGRWTLDEIRIGAARMTAILNKHSGKDVSSTGVPEQPTVTPEAEEAAPESFWQGLKACEEGRTVDMEKALNEAPPGEVLEAELRRRDRGIWWMREEFRSPWLSGFRAGAEWAQHQKEVMPNDGVDSAHVTPGGCASGEQTQQLLPCPFCGNEVFPPQRHLNWTVECAWCAASQIGETREQAIERWNRRAPVPAPDTDFMAELPPHKPDHAFDLDAELKKRLTRWIPRTERMPTKEDANSRGSVLWTDAREPREDYYNVLLWDHEPDDEWTHWMPAPEPPESVKPQTWEEALAEKEGEIDELRQDVPELRCVDNFRDGAEWALNWARQHKEEL